MVCAYIASTVVDSGTSATFNSSAALTGTDPVAGASSHQISLQHQTRPANGALFSISNGCGCTADIGAWLPPAPVMTDVSPTGIARARIIASLEAEQITYHIPQMSNLAQICTDPFSANCISNTPRSCDRSSALARIEHLRRQTRRHR